jgi:hypothetical protein
LAVAAYFAFPLPLSALDRTLAGARPYERQVQGQNLPRYGARSSGAAGDVRRRDARRHRQHDRYAELYRIDPARIRPGTTLRGSSTSASPAGHYAGWSTDDVVREMARRAASKQVSRIVNRLKLRWAHRCARSIRSRADGGWV